MFLIKLKAE